MSDPKTQEDWTIHAINIHGLIFERWCQSVVNSAKGWRLKTTNYPVEFPRSSMALLGKESSLDIRAETDSASEKVVLLIECKKNNPEFTNWIFFRKPTDNDPKQMTIGSILNIPKEPPAVGWTSTAQLRTLSSTFTVANDARETRGDYLGYKKDNSKTRTANAAISEAAYQVALATQAISVEDTAFSASLSWAANPMMKWKEEYLFPLIVTTARLHLCDFLATDVDGATGEIAFEKPSLVETPALIYEYPLPKHLQFIPTELIPILEKDSIEKFMRKDILVVHSEYFETFLRTFYNHGELESREQKSESAKQP